MNPIQALRITIATATLLVGCGREETSVVKPPETPRTEPRPANPIPEDETYGRRTEFAIRTKARLDALNTELQSLESRVAVAGDAAKADSEARLKTLREKTAALRIKIDAMVEAKESDWDSVKNATKGGLDELQDQFKSFRQWLSEKIAP